MRRIIALAFAAGLVLAGCGGDDGGGAAVERPEASDDLEAMALTLEDLPSGWAVDDSDSDGDSPIECTNETRALMADQPLVTVGFVGDGDRPLLQQQLVGSADRLDQVVEIFDGCGSFAFTFEGSDVEGSVDRLGLDGPEGADDAHSWLVTLTVDGLALEGITSVSSHGDVLMSLTYLDLTSADPTEFGELADLAAGKLTT